MAAPNIQFGLPKAGADNIATWYIYHEALVWGSAQTLADTVLSDQGNAKAEQYRTELLQSKSTQMNFVIDGIRAEVAMEFDQQNTSEPLQFQMYRLLHYSRLRFEVNKVVLSDIPLVLLLPYQLIYTIAGTWNVQPNYQQFLNLKTPIEYPYGGNATIKLIVATNVVSKTGTTALGYLTGTTGGTGVTSSQGWSMDFYFRCRQAIPS